MQNATEKVEKPRRGPGRPFLPGHDAKAIGAGRKKGAVPAARLAAKREAEIALQTLQRMQDEIARMDGPTLARFASKPALEFLVATVNDSNASTGDRLQAARALISTGWVEAPKQSINLTGDIGRMSDAALAKMLGMPSQGKPPALAVIGEPAIASELTLNAAPRALETTPQGAALPAPQAKP